MQLINVGTTTTDEQAAPEFVPIYVQAGGAGTTVTFLSGDTLSYYTSFDGGPAGTIATNQTFTAGPVWLVSNSVTSVQLTGPGY